MIEQLRRSLSFRLLAIFIVLAAAFAVLSIAGLRWIYQQDDLRELVSGHLSLHVGYVRRDIGDPPRIERALQITRQVPVDIRIAGAGVDWASDPEFPAPGELSFGQSDFFSPDPGAWLDELEGVEFAERDGHQFLKLEQGGFDIIVASPRIADEVISPPLLPVILGIGLVWLFIAYLCVNWLFRPIRAIRQGAARIGGGDFDHRITGYRQDQLGDLAQDVNRLAADVRGMLDAKRQLLLGISHELRTPLSRLRLALEFVDGEQARDDLRHEIVEMEQIISTLLEAERLNTRHAALQRSRVFLPGLVEQLIDTYFDKDARRVVVEIDDRAQEVNIDPVRVVLLLKNLLGNALRYAGEGEQPVRIEAAVAGHDLVLAVSDRGPGLSPDQQARLGEPFYRPDPSRQRDTGGFGLGLYLARLVAQAHGGSLWVDPDHRPGARLVARLADAVME